MFGSQTTQQSVHGTDFAAFAQDRVQPGTRWWVEFGGRLDCDASPAHRRHAARGSGRSAGRHRQHRASRRLGVFYERTPLVAGAFDDFENATRHAVRHRRDHAARPGRALHARHGAEPPGRPQHGLGRLLRQAPEPRPVAAPERPRPARQPRTDRRSGPDGNRRRAVLSSTGESSYLQQEVNLHVTRGQVSTSARRTSIRPRARI